MIDVFQSFNKLILYSKYKRFFTLSPTLVLSFKLNMTTTTTHIFRDLFTHLRIGLLNK